MARPIEPRCAGAADPASARGPSPDAGHTLCHLHRCPCRSQYLHSRARCYRNAGCGRVCCTAVGSGWATQGQPAHTRLLLSAGFPQKQRSKQKWFTWRGSQEVTQGSGRRLTRGGKAASTVCQVQLWTPGPQGTLGNRRARPLPKGRGAGVFIPHPSNAHVRLAKGCPCGVGVGVRHVLEC